MKRLGFLLAFLGFWSVLSHMPASADEYDETQSHPLRIVAYTVHPVGVLLEWMLLRPAHAIVSLKGLDYLVGHKPHPPLFADPQPDYDVGATKRGPMERTEELRKKAAPPELEEPIAERVTVKEVVVEKVVMGEISPTAAPEVVFFPAVAFQFNSDRLTDLGMGKIYLVAQRFKDRPDVAVVIEGHTDQIGTEEFNRVLGLRRAERVKEELVRMGVDPARITVASMGKSRPLVEQETDWARALNRRVEFKISTTP